MNACGPNCGWCGRCTSASESRDDKPAHLCDRDGCDRTLNMFAVTVAGVGRFCSRNCATKAQQHETETMAGDGHGRR